LLALMINSQAGLPLIVYAPVPNTAIDCARVFVRVTDVELTLRAGKYAAVATASSAARENVIVI
jgi:hypothetical protein